VIHIKKNLYDHGDIFGCSNINKVHVCFWKKVIVEKRPGSNLPDLENKKFLGKTFI
jgi:hypothetical protein